MTRQELIEAVDWARTQIDRVPPLPAPRIAFYRSLVLAGEKQIRSMAKTRIVTVWHVEYVDHGKVKHVEPVDSRMIADARQGALRAQGMWCVRVCGPRKHEVPA